MSGLADRGHALAELLVALLVGLVLLGVGVGLVRTSVRAVDALGRTNDGTAALRLTRHVLSTEARWAGGPQAVEGDSMALRAFRGVAWVCRGRRTEPSVVRVAALGLRRPNVAKDSVVLVGTPGAPAVAALLDVAPDTGSCAGTPGVTPERWTLSRPAPFDVVALRYFERGSYHLSGGALRYRRGQGGRQPLTPAVLRTPPSGFERGSSPSARVWSIGGGGGVRVDLQGR